MWKTLDAHVAGGAVRLVTSGVPVLAGTTIAERRQSFEHQADDVRLLLCREPRGHSGLVAVVLTESEREGADAGMLFLTGAGYRPLSGHAAMGAVASALNDGLLGPRQGGAVQLDTEAGEVEVRVTGRDVTGRVTSVALQSPPAMVVRGKVRVVTERRAFSVDIAWSGSELLAIVDAEGAGVPLAPQRALEIQRAGRQTLQSLEESVTVTAPGAAGAGVISGCVFVGPAASDTADIRNVLVRADGTLARSPSASATGAVSAVLSAMGVLPPGASSRHESLSGLSWVATVAPAQQEDSSAAVLVRIDAEVFATGRHEFVREGGDVAHSAAVWVV